MRSCINTRLTFGGVPRAIRQPRLSRASSNIFRRILDGGAALPLKEIKLLGVVGELWRGQRDRSSVNSAAVRINHADELRVAALKSYTRTRRMKGFLGKLLGIRSR